MRIAYNKTITVSIDEVLSTNALLKLVHKRTGIPMEWQRISFCGKTLEPGYTLADYGIRNESTLFQIGRLYAGMPYGCCVSNAHNFCNMSAGLLGGAMFVSNVWL